MPIARAVIVIRRTKNSYQCADIVFFSAADNELSGKEIKGLTNEKVPAGSNTVRFIFSLFYFFVARKKV